jgi:hypothetical protein
MLRIEATFKYSVMCNQYWTRMTSEVFVVSSHVDLFSCNKSSEGMSHCFDDWELGIAPGYINSHSSQ